ncbi:MAG: peptidase M15, partial [Pseudomonadales bacterium]
KESPGEHTIGKACDIPCWSDEAFEIVKLATQVGFTRVGVSQNKRGERFVHLGSATPEDGFPKALYSY